MQYSGRTEVRALKQARFVALFQFEQVLFYHLDLLGKFEKRPQHFVLRGRVVQARHQRVQRSDQRAELIHLFANFGYGRALFHQAILIARPASRNERVAGTTAPVVAGWMGCVSRSIWCAGLPSSFPEKSTAEHLSRINLPPTRLVRFALCGFAFSSSRESLLSTRNGTELADFPLALARQAERIMALMLQKIMSAAGVTPTCPRCGRSISSEDVNVAQDIAFCRNCDMAHSLSALISGTVLDENVDESRPPAGSWARREGDTLVLGATHRSVGQAFAMLFFALFWNGIVSVFVMLALSSTLHHLGVSLPAWFPAHFFKTGNVVPVGVTLFLWLFLAPFMAVGCLLLFMFLSSLGGRTELRLQGGQGTLFTGIGPVGFRKQFAFSEIRSVRMEDRSWVDSNGTQHRSAQIILDADPKPIKFGSMLTRDRRRFLGGALKKELGHLS